MYAHRDLVHLASFARKPNVAIAAGREALTRSSPRKRSHHASQNRNSPSGAQRHLCHGRRNSRQYYPPSQRHRDRRTPPPSKASSATSPAPSKARNPPPRISARIASPNATKPARLSAFSRKKATSTSRSPKPCRTPARPKLQPFVGQWVSATGKTFLRNGTHGIEITNIHAIDA